MIIIAKSFIEIVSDGAEKIEPYSRNLGLETRLTDQDSEDSWATKLNNIHVHSFVLL
jgi:hypothetical protein